MVIVDTSIIIDHLRQTSPDATLLEKLFATEGEGSIAVSTISVQELYAGKSTLDPVKEGHLTKLLSKLVLIPYSLETAQLAGKLARDMSGYLRFADAATAATALLKSCPVATLNVKDFEKIEGLEVHRG